MKKFSIQNFNIPKLIKISEKNIEEHLKLYEGYVKNANLVMDLYEKLATDQEKNAYLLGELKRRFSFEFNGMKNHELYFSGFEGGPISLASNGNLYKMIEQGWGSYENWEKEFKTMAATRGIGWAMLYHDNKNGILINSWVDEQHLGQLSGCSPILGLDMWEHSYVYDFQPSGKKIYIEAFFENLNWKNIEKNFEAVPK